MSEEKYSLTEYVFRDIRVVKCRSNSFKADVKKELANKRDPIEKVKKYQEIMGKKYNHKKPDAERWTIALDSYKNYPCFIDRDEYSIEDGYLHYVHKGFKINVTADVLTGPSEIIKPAEALGLENHEALKEFCSVAYTIGNVCPVMNNGYDGDDTCWHKLKAFIERGKMYTGIEDAGWPQYVSRRKYKDIFAVFPEELTGEKIVDRLMLNDYYDDDDYNLIITDTPAQRASKGVDEYIDFLRLVTTLIIKRGIRIYYKSKVDNLNLDKLADELINEKKKGLQNSAHA